MKYRYQIRATNSKWIVVDTDRNCVAIAGPYKSMTWAFKRAIKLNGGELCPKK